VLVVSDLECARGDRVLFSGLSFTLAPGMLIHLRGANGCGKTTLLRAIAGLTDPIHGAVHWRGASIVEHREDYSASLSFIGHTNALHGELNARENLRFAALLGGLDAGDVLIDHALEQVDLIAYARLPAKVLSQGQKRRLALARLSLSNKPLWILDEPFTALDASSFDRITSLIDRHLAADGMVLISSHQALTVETMRIQTLSLDQ
jgi:heme exporter protein A